jgi:hypothetical protein
MPVIGFLGDQRRYVRIPLRLRSSLLAELINDDTEMPALGDPWALVHNVLGWESEHVAGSPGGPPLPEQLQIRLPQQDTTLSPTWAVKELGGAAAPAATTRRVA